MSTPALETWYSERCAELDALVDVHENAVGERSRTRTSTLFGRLLYVALAAEFQGFCRDLHYGVALGLARIGGAPPDLQATYVLAMTDQAALRRRNATQASIRRDFQALGLQILSAVRDAGPRRYEGWLRQVDELNRVRNGVAHSDREVLADLPAENPTVRDWQSTRTAIADFVRRLS